MSEQNTSCSLNLLVEMMTDPRIKRLSYLSGQRYSAPPTQGPTWQGVLGIGILLAAIIAGLCLVYLWQEATIRNLTAQRESAQDRLIATQDVNRWLEFEVGKAFCLERVSSLARSELGMIEPVIIHYVHIDKPIPEN